MQTSSSFKKVYWKFFSSREYYCTAALVIGRITGAALTGSDKSPRSNPDAGNASSYIIKQLNTAANENRWAYVHVTNSLDGAENIFKQCPIEDTGLLGRCVDFSIPVLDANLGSIAFRDGYAYLASQGRPSIISTCEVSGSGSLDFCVSAESGIKYNVTHVETYGNFLYIMGKGSIYQCYIDESTGQGEDCIEVWAETSPGYHSVSIFKFHRGKVYINDAWLDSAGNEGKQITVCDIGKIYFENCFKTGPTASFDLAFYSDWAYVLARNWQDGATPHELYQCLIRSENGAFGNCEKTEPVPVENKFSLDVISLNNGSQPGMFIEADSRLYVCDIDTDYGTLGSCRKTFEIFGASEYIKDIFTYSPQTKQSLSGSNSRAISAAIVGTLIIGLVF